MIAKAQYKTPKIYAIAAGVIVFLILLIAFFTLGQVVKSFGNIFLFLPEQLGIIQTPKRAEIAEVNMSNPPTTLRFEQPGLYTVYTIDYDLLIINDELTKHELDPWLKITEIASGKPVKVDYVERGLRIYDTPLAKGRPIHTFFIETPGAYEVSHVTKNVSIYFLPDYITGNEDLLAMSYLGQLAVILVIAGIFYQRNAKKRAVKIQEVKLLKKIQEDEGKQFWKKYQDKPDDKGKKNYWR
ncbi:MAG: hypothetical protein K8R77_09830 [Anaerolineaceae bacterium]|nr:hypothetical protein [Anaerolineaceae bacterium]